MAGVKKFLSDKKTTQQGKQPHVRQKASPSGGPRRGWNFWKALGLRDQGNSQARRSACASWTAALGGRRQGLSCCGRGRGWGGGGVPFLDSRLNTHTRLGPASPARGTRPAETVLQRERPRERAEQPAGQEATRAPPGSSAAQVATVLMSPTQ